MALLTALDYEAIRKDRRAAKQVAYHYGISLSYVHQIRNGRAFRYKPIRPFVPDAILSFGA